MLRILTCFFFFFISCPHNNPQALVYPQCQRHSRTRIIRRRSIQTNTQCSSQQLSVVALFMQRRIITITIIIIIVVLICDVFGCILFSTVQQGKTPYPSNPCNIHKSCINIKMKSSRYTNQSYEPDSGKTEGKRIKYMKIKTFSSIEFSLVDGKSDFSRCCKWVAFPLFRRIRFSLFQNIQEDTIFVLLGILFLEWNSVRKKNFGKIHLLQDEI